MTSSGGPYRLYYWPTIQGRGEFVRLALEEAGASYIDVARGDESEGEGVRAMMRIMGDRDLLEPPFAPPFLIDGEVLIAQTANILLWLGPRLGLTPAGEAGRSFVNQLQLTIADLVDETHDTHHPIAGGLYYEDQKAEASRRAKDFRDNRVGKYLGYFERVLGVNPEGPSRLYGDAATYADLSLFQVVAGLRYAFPRTVAAGETHWPNIVALHRRVAQRPRIAAYLASRRRIPFNQDGVFRHYPELDL